MDLYAYIQGSKELKTRLIAMAALKVATVITSPSVSLSFDTDKAGFSEREVC